MVRLILFAAFAEQYTILSNQTDVSIGIDGLNTYLACVNGNKMAAKRCLPTDCKVYSMATIKPSLRSNVEPFRAMDVFAEAVRLKQQGQPIVSMAVGQPSAPAARPVIEAAEKALKDGRLSYTDALGLLPTREAIAESYQTLYGVNVSPERVVVTTGSTAGFNLAFLTFFDAGDRIAITAPGYPAYRNIIKALGLEVVEIPVHDCDGMLSAEALEATHKEKPLAGVLFASPANPTGAMIPDDALEALIHKAQSLDIKVISDEIYHRLNFTGPDKTALSVSDDLIIVNSFSKYYCMTGWRIGWMIVPEGHSRAVERVAQSLYISAPELSQRAVIAAFDVESTEQLEATKAIYAKSRDVVMDGLQALNMPLIAPMDGAFYAYCDVTAHTNDSMVLAGEMLKNAKVAATPGIDFDPLRGAETMRFSYAGAPEDMEKAIQNLKNWLL